MKYLQGLVTNKVIAASQKQGTKNSYWLMHLKPPTRPLLMPVWLCC